MHHIMFDIDGTLLQSYDIDSEFFAQAIKEITGLTPHTNWGEYQNVTDTGIVEEILLQQSIPIDSSVHNQIESCFIEKLKKAITIEPIQEVTGASAFIKMLQSREDVVLSIATGGWRQSAILKLESAGIDIANTPIATSNDHMTRTGIMQKAAERTIGNNNYPCTYFGDGIWDKKACKELGYNFILIGAKTRHANQFSDFSQVEAVLNCIGLES